MVTIWSSCALTSGYALCMLLLVWFVSHLVMRNFVIITMLLLIMGLNSVSASLDVLEELVMRSVRDYADSPWLCTNMQSVMVMRSVHDYAKCHGYA